jgi:outer membrane protein OmpA-like peptidoglycan-associated protein
VENTRRAEQARIAAEQARTAAAQAGVVGRTPAGAAIQFPDYEALTALLETIWFLGDVAIIVPEDAAKLDRVGAALAQDKDLSVLVTGHTALFGPARIGVELSRERAQLVSDYLITHWSIPAERVRIWGYGSGKPIEVNDTWAGRRMNRRVEVRVWRGHE